MTNLKAESQKDLSLGFQPATHPLFDPVNGERGNSSQAGQLRLTQHLGFADSSHLVVFVIHLDILKTVQASMIYQQLNIIRESHLPCQPKLHFNYV